MIFLYYASESYNSQARVLETSIKRFYPDNRVIRMTPQIKVTSGTYIPGLAKHRLVTALELLNDGNDSVVVLGADCELFDEMTEVDEALKTNDIIIVPHCVSPVDKSYMTQVYKTGHANADLMVFKNTDNSKKALEWLISVTEGEDKSQGIFYEQTWLSATPFIFDKVYILRHPGYNVGYWDIDKRDVKKVNGKWMVGNLPIKMVQYSGFIKDEPEKISKYSKIKATGDILTLMIEYRDKLK